jgi:hypothetical protein
VTVIAQMFNYLDLIDWTPVLEVMTIIGTMLIAYQMQYTERFEVELGLDHGLVWSVLRRLAFSGKMLGMLWVIGYAHSHEWRPWPPFVLLVFSLNLYIFVQIMIMRMDVTSARRSV